MKERLLPRLEKDSSKFQDDILQLWNDGNALINENFLKVVEGDNFRQKVGTWLIKIDTYFIKHFSIENNVFRNLLSSGSWEKASPLIIKDYDKQQLINTVKEKLSRLNYVGKLIMMSDAVLDHYDLIERKRLGYDLDEKIELVLNKLYQVYDSELYFNLEHIFICNALPMRRKADIKFFAELLAQDEYIEIKYSEEHEDIEVRLTSKGAYEVQDSIRRKKLKKSEMEISDFDKTLNEIREELEKANLGNEILYEELQEIKLALGKVRKKNLFEMVKGKMFDLALKEVISKETAKFVYEKITGEKFNAPALLHSVVTAINDTVDWTK